MHEIIRPSDFQHDTIQAGTLRMHAVLEGDSTDPLVIMLHGFPEFWYSWRFQIKPLAKEGYHVVAPDLRGYNLTQKEGPYDVLTIIKDIENLIHAFGREEAIIIGHDWGSIISWVFAALHADMTEKLIVCNVPHPNAALKALKSFYLPQILKSWYIGFFQIPRLPEKVFRANHYKVLRYGMQTAIADGMTEEEIGYYCEAWSQKDALSAVIGYYRAVLGSLRQLQELDLTVQVPTQLIWGEPDIALDTQLARWSGEWCPSLDLRVIPNSNHFVQLYSAQLVTAYMIDFLKKSKNI